MPPPFAQDLNGRYLKNMVNFNIYIAFYNKSKYNKSDTILSEDE